MKAFFKQCYRRFMYFFYHKRIVHSTKFMPGEFVRVVGAGKQRFIRVQFSNKILKKETMPFTDIPFEHVTGIGRLPSEFEKWLYRLVGKKPKSTFYKLK